MTTESRRTPDENVIGTVIGHYKVTAVLNQGGMGAVYRAEHPLIGKPAVIKLLLPELSSDAEMVHRFFNEAKASSAIRHPGIVEIFDFGYHGDGRAYIVMEFLDGESLAERLAERGRLPELEAASLGRSIAGALAAAHAKNIVHRDLKPDNIFLVQDPDMPTGERTKILDFGIAKLSNDQPTEMSRTRTGAMMGTPLYMAPEQARGAGEVDARADLYALGCMLYEMLCGDPPFLAEGAGEIIAMQLFAEPVPPREIVPELSMEIEGIVMSLLEKDPKKRPQKSKDVADALATVMPRLSSRLSAAVPVPPQTKMRAVVTPRPVAAKMSGPRPTTNEPALSIPPSTAEQSVPTIDPADVPSITPRSLAARAEPKPTTLGGSAAHVIPTLPPDERPRGKTGWIVAGGIAVAAAIAAFVVVKRMRADDGAGTKPTTTAIAPTPAPTKPQPPITPPPSTPPAPATITLMLSLQPPDAAVMIDGAAVELTNGATQLTRDGRDHVVEASAPGHVASTITVTADHDLAKAMALAVAPTTPPVTTPPVTTPSHPPHIGHIRTPVRPVKPTGPATTPTHDTKPTTSPNGSPIETTL